MAIAALAFSLTVTGNLTFSQMRHAKTADNLIDNPFGRHVLDKEIAEQVSPSRQSAVRAKVEEEIELQATKAVTEKTSGTEVGKIVNGALERARAQVINVAIVLWIIAGAGLFITAIIHTNGHQMMRNGSRALLASAGACIIPSVLFGMLVNDVFPGPLRWFSQMMMDDRAGLLPIGSGLLVAAGICALAGQMFKPVRKGGNRKSKGVRTTF